MASPSAWSVSPLASSASLTSKNVRCSRETSTAWLRNQGRPSGRSFLLTLSTNVDLIFEADVFLCVFEKCCIFVFTALLPQQTKITTTMNTKNRQDEQQRHARRNYVVREVRNQLVSYFEYSYTNADIFIGEIWGLGERKIREIVRTDLPNRIGCHPKRSVRFLRSIYLLLCAAMCSRFFCGFVRRITRCAEMCRDVPRSVFENPLILYRI